ncbi:MAG: inositol monophosphatase [Planctomycetota bacterium]
MIDTRELAQRRSFARQVIGQMSRLVKDRYISGSPADVESEQLFRSQVSRRFPNDPVAGEELGYDPGSDHNGWLVDPLDGSSNHSQGIPLFAVSIAYRIKGKTVLGLISDPVRGEWFEALDGKGICCGGPSPARKPASGPAVICLSPRWRAAYPDWRQQLPSGTKQRSLGSIALEMAWISQGRIQAGAWFRTHPWDVCAGDLLIQESGGRVTDVQKSKVGEKFATAAGADIFDKALQVTISSSLAERGGDAQDQDTV